MNLTPGTTPCTTVAHTPQTRTVNTEFGAYAFAWGRTKELANYGMFYHKRFRDNYEAGAKYEIEVYVDGTVFTGTFEWRAEEKKATRTSAIKETRRYVVGPTTHTAENYREWVRGLVRAGLLPNKTGAPLM